MTKKLAVRWQVAEKQGGKGRERKGRKKGMGREEERERKEEQRKKRRNELRERNTRRGEREVTRP